jgi:hypothetical protein
MFRVVDERKEGGRCEKRKRKVSMHTQRVQCDPFWETLCGLVGVVFNRAFTRCTTNVLNFPLKYKIRV